jgi:hypothetical protein
VSLISCLACGYEGRSFRVGATGRPRADGTPVVRRLCRWCYANPATRAAFRSEAKRISRREGMRRMRQRTWQERADYIKSVTVLGPCPCHDCRVPLRYVRVLGWVEADGHLHRCKAVNGRRIVPRHTNENPSIVTLEGSSHVNVRYTVQPVGQERNPTDDPPLARRAAPVTGEWRSTTSPQVVDSVHVPPTQSASSDGSRHAEPITDQGAPGRGPQGEGHLLNADRPPKQLEDSRATSSGNGGRLPPSPASLSRTVVGRR